MPSKKTYQPGCGFTVINIVKTGDPCSLPCEFVFPDRPYIDLNSLFMGGMPIILSTTINTDISDAKFSIVNSLPFAFNAKNQSHQRGMRVLRQVASVWPASHIAIHIVTGPFWSLRQHKISTPIRWLNFKHD